MKFAEAISDGKKQPYLQNWPPQAEETAAADETSSGALEEDPLVLNSKGPGAGRVRDKLYKVEGKEMPTSSKCT